MITSLVLLAALPLVGDDAPVVEALASPAPKRSGIPSLTSGADGVTYLTWIEQGRGAATLRLAALGAEGWGEPATIGAGSDWFVNWADVPTLAALADGTLAASWLVRSGQHAYDAFAATSTDAGATWSDPVRLNASPEGAEHGFVSLAPLASGAFAAIWLDGRNMKGHGRGQTGLYHRMLAKDGTLGDEVVLDPRVCDCCPTSAASDGRSIVAVYRDRGDKAEIRDVSTVRFDGEAWGESAKVHDDGWEMPGCPVNGPSIVLAGGRAVVAWYTGAVGAGSVLLAFEGDDGTFGAPLDVDDRAPIGRVSLAPLADGSVLVAWLESAGSAGEWRVRRVTPAGKLSAAATLATVDPGRRSGRLFLAPHEDGAIAAWTADGPPRRVATARVRPSDAR